MCLFRISSIIRTVSSSIEIERIKMMGKINRINDLKTKGALKFEQKTISMLLTISIVAFVLSAIMQYVFPFFIEESTLELYHYQYIINVLLGGACSATISLICVWIPFISKKEAQETIVILKVKKLYFAYNSLISSVVGNSDRDEKDKTYLGEICLFKACKELEDASNELSDVYNKSNITSDNIERIIDHVDIVFLPVAKMTRNFVTIVVPPEHAANPEGVPITQEHQYFDAEQNSALYNQLLTSLEKITPYEEAVKIFADYINPSDAVIELLKNSTHNLLSSVQTHSEQKKISTIQIELNNQLVKINHEHSQKRMSRDIRNIERLQSLQKRINLLPKEEQDIYAPMLDKIYADLNIKQSVEIEKALNELEDKLNNL